MQIVPVDRAEPKRQGLDALLEGWSSFRDGWLLLDMAVVLLLALLLGAVIAYHPATRRRVSSLEHFEQPKTLLMYAVVAAVGSCCSFSRVRVVRCMVRSMKALLCTRHGEPEALELGELPAPPCGPHALRIAVHSAGVNYPDALIIAGKYQFQPPLPFAPGGEVAGTVLELGEAVTGFAVGDRVMGMCGWNGYAEEVVVPATIARPP